MKKILIVTADYYKDITASLLKSANNNLNKFSPFFILSLNSPARKNAINVNNNQ